MFILRIMTKFLKVEDLNEILYVFCLMSSAYETDTPKSLGQKEGDTIECFDRYSNHIMLYSFNYGEFGQILYIRHLKFYFIC